MVYVHIVLHKLIAIVNIKIGLVLQWNLLIRKREEEKGIWDNVPFVALYTGSKIIG